MAYAPVKDIGLAAELRKIDNELGKVRPGHGFIAQVDKPNLTLALKVADAKPLAASRRDTSGSSRPTGSTV